MDNITIKAGHILLFILLQLSFDGMANSPRNLLQKRASLSDVRKLVSIDKAWVPYPRYLEREKWNTLMGTFSAEYVNRGEGYLDYRWQLIKASDYFHFERTGALGAVEIPFEQNVLALSNLLMAELAEGNGRFIDQIIDGVWLFSEMTSWSSATHLASLQKTRRSLPDHAEHIIDLAGADLASLLSWTYYFLKDQFDEKDPAISSKLRYALEEKVINTYRERDDFWWQGFNLKPGGLVNNWNPWCNFNVLTCLLLIEDDLDDLAAGVCRTMRSVDQFINYINQDGACEEGPSYWGHAAGKLYDYLQLLAYATKGEINIFDEAIVRNMGEYIAYSYVSNGWVVNFADASAKNTTDFVLIYRYGKAINSTSMQQFASYMCNYSNADITVPTVIKRDFFRALESIGVLPELAAIPPKLPDFSTRWYSETEFCFMKNAKGIFFASKGGHNNESHNHNDIGTFNLYIDSIPLFIDVGVGKYSRKTFSKDRYSIWTMQSAFHNLPKINGYDQVFGSAYTAGSTEFNQEKMKFSLDISGAYPKAAGVHVWTREYELTPQELLITETYNIQQPTVRNEINFMTWISPSIAREGEVVLSRNGKVVKLLYNPKLFTVRCEPIKVDDTNLKRVWGEDLFRIVLTSKALQKNGRHKFQIKFQEQ